MRFSLASTNRAKLVARSLRRLLAARGTELPLSRCQTAVAEMYGYRNWLDLVRSCGSGQPSPDDADCSVTEVEARRARHAETLRRLGVVDPDDLLRNLRPTDRGSRPGDLPTLRVEAFERDAADLTIRSLGLQDLTRAVVDWMVPFSPRQRSHRVGPMPIRLFPDVPTVAMLHGSLSPEARRVGYEGRMALPGLTNALSRFLAAVGPREALADFKRRLDDVAAAARRMDDARTTLDRVEKARFTTDVADIEWFHTRFSRPEFVSHPSDAFASWGWDDYVAEHPRPDWGDEAAFEAWNEAYAAWLFDNSPPFVFGTVPVVWEGVDPAAVRGLVADMASEGDEDLNFDVASHIGDLLEEHHEDAFDLVVDLSQLEAIIADWLPHAGKETKEDASLEASVSAWNARQTIVSHYPNTSVVVPAWPGKSREDAIAWCRKVMEETRKAHAELLWWDRDQYQQAASPEPDHAVSDP